MAHHSYVVVGDLEEGISAAHSFAARELGLEGTAHPDIIVLRHGLLSVDDARKMRSLAELSPTQGSAKVLVVSASRLFHEAQNALLKLFEEPPAGTHLILVIPAEGMLLPTLRSRVLPLPILGGAVHTPSSSASVETESFIDATKLEREKILAKLLERTKSDKDEEKQVARLSALHLVEGLTRRAHMQLAHSSSKRAELQSFLNDANTFLPILHERSAPLKLIFEHILLTLPDLRRSASGV